MYADNATYKQSVPCLAESKTKIARNMNLHKVCNHYTITQQSSLATTGRDTGLPPVILKHKA